MNTITTPKAKTTDTLIQVRVPADLKRRTAELFESLGTNTSAVIKSMLTLADETRSIPFKVRTDAYPISAAERIDEIKATFELEGMPLDDEDMKDLQDIELAKTTTEAVRQKYIDRYKKNGGN